jgi:hypothetical protein
VKHLSYLVGACLGAALLAGCGGSSNRFYPPTPLSGVPQPDLGHYVANAGPGSAKPLTSPLSGEAFIARNVTVTTEECNHGKWDATSVTFSAVGKTKGPYPGTFVATGSWGNSLFFNTLWTFSESFKITSGTRKISGRILGRGHGFNNAQGCTSFGPARKSLGLKYHFGGGRYSGPVIVKDIVSGSLHEELL